MSLTSKLLNKATLFGISHFTMSSSYRYRTHSCIIKDFVFDQMLTNYVIRATKDVDLYYSCFILDILLSMCVIP